MEVFPSMTEASCPAYRAMRFGEKTRSKVLDVKFYGTDYRCTVNIMVVTRHGTTIGAVCTGKVLEGDYSRDSITLPELASSTGRHLYEVGDIIGSSQETRMLRLKVKRGGGLPVQRPDPRRNRNREGTGGAVPPHQQPAPGGSLPFPELRRHPPYPSWKAPSSAPTKGSFTGAENRPGVFELAHGGTVFLDELNSMDLGIQAKLLKAIEEKTITRVGGTEARRIDIRIISAINETPDRCLRGEHRPGRPVLPPRGRVQDPPCATTRAESRPAGSAEAFHRERLNRDRNAGIQGFSEEVLQLFETYDWPGNVRELRNVVETACTFNTGPVIERDDLPEYLNHGDPIALGPPAAMVNSLNDALERFEKQIIEARAGEAHSLTELAEFLQVSRQTLKYKLKKHGLNPFRD